MSEAVTRLEIDYASRSEAGSKAENADSCDAHIPGHGAIRSKGIAVALADGMSSSEGGREAAEICVRSFLLDYYSTPDSWTVRTASAKVLGAINRWLWSQGQQVYDSPRGMVSTLTALVLKSTTAHIVHVGDSRLYRYRDGEMEQLTRDHRVWVSREREFLSRAMGADPHIDIDYRAEAMEAGDTFLFATDGVYEVLSHKELSSMLGEADNLQACANRIVESALRCGSPDNVTCQLVRVLSLPASGEDELITRINELPFPPNLEPGVTIDGYRILKELHASKRSEVFLALDIESGEKVVLKTPSEHYRDDPEFLNAFMQEEWVGRQASSLHLLKLYEPRNRRFLYNIGEYVEGQTLTQWMNDRDSVMLDEVRDVARQLIQALRALHRLEMYHQDLKPDNVLIDKTGMIKVIDFGGVSIAAAVEASGNPGSSLPRGTLDYAAPECLRGERATTASDIYSLAVILYELLARKLPYGEMDHYKPDRRFKYRSVRTWNQKIPVWVDGALEKALSPDPARRYQVMSEFERDLVRPNPDLVPGNSRPLIERNPLRFWQGLALMLLVLNVVLLYMLSR